MNFQRFEELHKFLKNLPRARIYLRVYSGVRDAAGFVQESTQIPDFYQCDSVGCIAGWTCALFREHPAVYKNPNAQLHDIAQELLELTPD